jgi:hypothetical protein
VPQASTQRDHAFVAPVRIASEISSQGACCVQCSKQTKFSEQLPKWRDPSHDVPASTFKQASMRSQLSSQT